MSQKISLVGHLFGRLAVLYESPRPSTVRNKQAYWTCLCACGKTIVTRTDNLKSGNTQSCGCFRTDALVARMTVHGYCPRGTHAPEYYSWRCMIERCTNPKAPNFRWYGGRGVSICSRLRQSFAAFLADMGNKPNSKYTIERVNVNGNYEPSNCIWLHVSKQHENKRNRIKPCI